ncbi:MAG: hypothetical protein U0174_17250 [Polyangiaceae bacterium]
MNRVDLPSGERIEQALVRAAGAGSWVRAMGTVSHVAMRVAPSESPRGLDGTWTLVSFDAVVAEHSCTMHAVVSRQGAWGPELCAGELVTAEVVRVTCAVFTGKGDTAPLHDDDAAEDNPWASAISASASGDASERRRPASEEKKAAIPERARPQANFDQDFPEARDLVEHFHFGRAEVLKSDGDRLHVKVARDGRIKEIALQMLKVTRKDDEGGVRVFKLDRKV